MPRTLYQAGSIVHTLVAVPPREGDGGEPKPRFVLLLDDVLDDDQPVVCLPITTLIRKDLASISFQLPFNRNNPNGLTQPCVVICDWEFEVSSSEIEGARGAISDDLFIQIVERYLGPG